MSRVAINAWRREVYRSPLLTDGAKVLLLFFADSVTAVGKVSIPVLTISKATGMSAPRISERIAQAKRVGFLDTISPGVRGRTAVYDLLFPSGKRNESDPVSFRSAEAMPLRNPEGNSAGSTLSDPGFVPDSGVPVVRQPPEERPVTKPVGQVVDCRDCGGREPLDGNRRCADCAELRAAAS